MNNPYEILGIGKNASKKEIQKSYRDLARKYHPDVNKDEGAVEKFKEISCAYEILNNDQKRAEYDRFGSVEQNPFSGKQKPFTSNMDDFFSSFFGQRHQRQHSGDHIVVEQEIELVDVLNGKTVEIKYKKHSLCKSCNGVGGRQANCKQCKGSGKKIIHGQNMTVQTMCHVCEGTGKIIEKECGDCRNGFTTPEEQSFSFNIPKGIEDGMKFSFGGKGEPCANGVPGNLYIVVRVNSHNTFTRLSHGNILCNIPVSYGQLVLGGEIECPTLEGAVKLTIPKMTNSGTKLRLKNKGLPVFNKNGDIYNIGDELVQVTLSIPKEISEEHEDILNKLIVIETGGQSE